MGEVYYALPLNLGGIISKKEQPHISLRESIAEWIHLLVVTHYGECKHDETFGCEIWEHDFENISNSQKFKDEVQRAILKTLTLHEPRLSDVRLDLQIEQTEVLVHNRRIKIRIGIRVRGIIRKTNEQFLHQESFFIGPLSYF